MTIEDIQKSIQQVAEHFSSNPEAAVRQDHAAVAVMEEGLRCRVTGPGDAALVTDMPKAIGGGGTSARPGWLLRAALASCDATVIAMRAAQLGIVLSRLEVVVSSETDGRGLLGVADDVPPGPVEVRVCVRLAADGIPPERLREIVEWAEEHSPVGDTVRRAVPCRLEIESAGDPEA